MPKKLNVTFFLSVVAKAFVEWIPPQRNPPDKIEFTPDENLFFTNRTGPQGMYVS